jgi:queuine tRNA-ribosyltransferase
MKFQLHTTETKSAARAGTITIDHGQIETSIFMPAGTAGTVKAVHFKDIMDDVKAQINLGNTYHLSSLPASGCD